MCGVVVLCDGSGSAAAGARSRLDSKEKVGQTLRDRGRYGGCGGLMKTDEGRGGFVTKTTLATACDEWRGAGER